MPVLTYRSTDVYPDTGAPHIDRARVYHREIEQSIDAAAAGETVKATWSALSAITGTRNGQPGRVTGTDAGTHTDPVVGGTVDNEGEYAWSTSPAGWERVGDLVDLSGQVGEAIDGSSAKSALVDADQFGVTDSEASDALKKVTFADLKTSMLIEEKFGAAYNGTQLSVASATLRVDVSTTMKISWTTMRGGFAGGATAAVQIADLAETSLAHTEHLYIDLEGDTPPYAVVKAGTGVSLRADFAAGKKLSLVYNNGGTLLGPGADAVHRAVKVAQASWDPNEIVLETGRLGGQFDLYQKANPDPRSDAYIRWRVLHLSDTTYDVWRTSGVWHENRIGQYSWEQQRRIVTTGENETAFQHLSPSGWMGGSTHGNEVQTRVVLLVDGVPKPLPADSTPNNLFYRCRKVELIQESTLYEDGSALGTALCDVIKRWVWADGEMRLHARYTWLADKTLQGAYVAMLCCERDDVSGNITNYGYREPLWELENIASSGFGESKTLTRHIKVAGTTYAMELEMVSGWDTAFANRRAHIEDDPAYNKIRFDLTGSGYAVSNGDIWETVARYRISKTYA